MQIAVPNLSKYFCNSRLHWAVICLFGYLVFVLPIQILGLPSGFDMLTHIRFAAAFQDALASGQVLPSWANDNFGYGSVGIRFYPPISGYILSITQVLTNDWIFAFLIDCYFLFCVGCIGMYLFVKDWVNAGYGILAAMLYAIVPYRLAEFFQFFMYGEFTAWTIIPFCFLFVSRICRRGKWVDTLLFALSYSVLILTHLPTTIIVTICLPLYVLFLINRKNYRIVFTQLLGAIALTLAATAFRWVMLVSEVTWLAHNGPEHFKTGFYDFRIWLFPNFLTSHSNYLYVLTSWLFDVGVCLTIALLVPALFHLLLKISSTDDESHRRTVIASLATALFAFFMLSRLSFYVWDNVKFLQKLQFPSRWMSVLSFFSIVLFSISVGPLVAWFRQGQRIIVYPALALIAAIVVFDITQIIVPSVPLTAIERAQIDEQVYSEKIWKGWWPIWAREEAFQNTEQVRAGNRVVNIRSWGRESKEFVLQPGESMNVGVKLFYYPRWKATVNDRLTEIGMDENGVITIPVSSEESRVRLYFEEPQIIRVSDVVSLLTWVIGLCLTVFMFAKQHIPTISSRPMLDERFDYS